MAFLVNDLLSLSHDRNLREESNTNTDYELKNLISGKDRKFISIFSKWVFSSDF